MNSMKQLKLLFTLALSLSLTSCGFVNYVENTSMTDLKVKDELDAKKQEYIDSLYDLFDENDYEETEKREYINCIIEATAEILECDDIDNLMETFESNSIKLKGIKTKQQYLKELEDKKDEYIAKINGISSADAYREDELSTYKYYIDEAASAINSLTSVKDDFEAVYLAYKTAIESIKTDEDLLEEESDAFKAYKMNAIDEIENYINIDDYRETEAVAIKQLLLDVFDKITKADTYDDVDSAVRDFKIDSFNYDTDEKLYAKELANLVEECTANLNGCIKKSDYRNNEVTIIDTLLSSFNEEATKLTTKEEVSNLFNASKEILLSLKTDVVLYEEEKGVLIEELYPQLLSIVGYNNLSNEEKEYYDSFYNSLYLLTTKEEIQLAFIEEKIKKCESLAIAGDLESLTQFKLCLVEKLKYYLHKSLYRDAQKQEIDLIVSNHTGPVLSCSSHDLAVEAYNDAIDELDAVLTNNDMWDVYYDKVEDYIDTLTLGNKLTKEINQYSCNSWADVGKVFDYYGYYQINDSNYPYPFVRVKMLFDYSNDDIELNLYCNSELFVSNFDVDYYIDKEGYVVFELKTRETINYTSIDRVPAGQNRRPKIVYYDTIDIRTDNRSNNFDDFAYYHNTKGNLYVENSQQLWYALENGYVPVCKAGSMAEIVLFECKRVLREIVKNDMTDYEKIFTISNYLNDVVNYDTPYNYRTFAEGILFDGGGICQAYARAMLILLSLEGIQCKIDSAYNDKVHLHNGDHLYNYVYSIEDSVWYLLETHQDLWCYDMSYRGIMNAPKANSVRFNNLVFAKNICEGFFSHLKWGDNNPILISSSFDLSKIEEYYHNNDAFQLPIEYFYSDVDFLNYVKDESMDYVIRSDNILNKMSNYEVIIVKEA